MSNKWMRISGQVGKRRKRQWRAASKGIHSNLGLGKVAQRDMDGDKDAKGGVGRESEA